MVFTDWMICESASAMNVGTMLPGSYLSVISCKRRSTVTGFPAGLVVMSQ
ncbi:hypothetical protein [Actinoplanes sp. NPDC051851]